MEKIYLDNAATTPLIPEVIDAMLETLTYNFGNPSSQHYYGRKAKQALENSRQQIAKKFNAKSNEIVFTSGGTESNNLVFNNIVLQNKLQPKHIITSTIEHPSILQTCAQLEKRGWEITYIPVNKQGIVSLTHIEKALKDSTVLVSIMAVNHETGAIQPIEKITSILDGHNTLFHSDAVQAFGKIPIATNLMKIDFLSISAHKIGAAKGCGALYIKSGTPFHSQLFGGLQEYGFRPGTENIASIVGFATATNLLDSHRYVQNIQKMSTWKNIFFNELKNVSYWDSSPPETTISSILNVSFPKLHIDTLTTMLDINGIAVSNGTACTSGTNKPSYVLKAIYGNDSYEKITNSVRISFGTTNSTEQITYAAKKLAAIVKKLQSTN